MHAKSIAPALGLALFWGGWAQAAQPVSVAASENVNKPPVGFVQGGLGLLEVAHVEAGLYLGPRLTVEAYQAWLGVFGGKSGLGGTLTLGTLRAPGRPPRHSLLVNTRFMIGSDFELTSDGDRLGAYLTSGLGYGFTGDGHFIARIMAGPVLTWDTKRDDAGRARRDTSLVCCFVLGSAGLTF